jgi:hypothetical protein
LYWKHQICAYLWKCAYLVNFCPCRFALIWMLSNQFKASNTCSRRSAIQEKWNYQALKSFKNSVFSLTIENLQSGPVFGSRARARSFPACELFTAGEDRHDPHILAAPKCASQQNWSCGQNGRQKWAISIVVQKRDFFDPNYWWTVEHCKRWKLVYKMLYIVVVSALSSDELTLIYSLGQMTFFRLLTRPFCWMSANQSKPTLFASRECSKESINQIWADSVDPGKTWIGL